MVVRSSHLAARFYKDDGWNQEILDSCMEKGTIEFADTLYGRGYYRLVPYSRYDVDKLLEHVTEIIHYDGHKLPKEEFKQYLENLNW